MSLRYCFESEYVLATLNRSRRNDLAVIDTDGIDGSLIQSAVKRGVYVYGYVNVGALESGRFYYPQYKHLRLAKYDGWNGEYWIDPTAPEWKAHIIDLGKKIKALGGIGIYFDNSDIYYMVKDKKLRKQYSRAIPSADSVYKALSDIVIGLHNLGLIVMPNGGDVFAKKFITKHPGIISTINQEGLFYEDFKKQSKSETAYRKNWMKWAAKHVSGKVRGIEYCKRAPEIAACKAYYSAHGWDVYISKHKDLRGD